jgi:hypothetical protein
MDPLIGSAHSERLFHTQTMHIKLQITLAQSFSPNLARDG